MVVLHTKGETMELYEGNQGLGFQSDNIHGTHHFITMFRNHWFGDIYNNPTKTANTEVANFWAYSRFFNVVGNVLGRTGYYTNYEANLGGGAKDIFVLGAPDGSPIPADPRVKATLLRWGNYDTVTGTSRFNAAEVPSGLTNYANPVPGNQVLPSSFYLSSRPLFFGNVPWPAVGPDVTGGDVAGFAGHAFKNPARLCYENTPVDTSYSGTVRRFNPSICYSSATTPPAPDSPTNLRIIR
jgi:hypothetical protein